MTARLPPLFPAFRGMFPDITPETHLCAFPLPGINGGMSHDLKNNGFLGSRSSAPVVRLRINPGRNVCVDLTEIGREFARSFHQKKTSMLIECYLKINGRELIQIFASRVSLAPPVAVQSLTIPLGGPGPGTVFILCHGPDSRMVQLWRSVEPKRA